MEKLSHEQKNEMLFFTLVEYWRFQAWMSLGKVKNPATNKIERNLEMAKQAIDMLDMLKEKTRGNLTENEERLLTQVLANLKLNYVDEYEKERRQRARQAEQKLAETAAEAKVSRQQKEETAPGTNTASSDQKAASAEKENASSNN